MGLLKFLRDVFKPTKPRYRRSSAGAVFEKKQGAYAQGYTDGRNGRANRHSHGSEGDPHGDERKIRATLNAPGTPAAYKRGYRQGVRHERNDHGWDERPPTRKR